MRTLRHTVVILLALTMSASRGPLPVESPPMQAVTPSDLHLIPLPAQLSTRQGAFPLTAATAIAVSDPGDPELRALGDYAVAIINAETGIALRMGAGSQPDTDDTILLQLDDGALDRDAENYHLDVGSHLTTISAPGYAGLFYGLQTLRQLLSIPRPDSDSDADKVIIPAVTVEDQPRFRYRGMHLDVGRHFFPISFIKRYIDLMSMFKMNTFHWHLTEDQGWRIEIEKYPRLTEVGAYRKETIVEKNFRPYVGDGTPHGGFYTQDEVREVVAYARSRYVTVIPEIEMPGHSKAALAAYPELACTDGPFEVATVWGVHEDIYCPSERTFAFLEDVLTEVMALFPSRYIHIGGDEAPKRRWRESAVAQQLMQREGLADEHELQSHFIKRIERFLLERGRRLIGWDEILQGGLAPEATVMSWRGMDGGIEAARQGHDVIMTPGSHVYFDHYQGERQYEPLAIGGYSPLEKVYAFDPVPEELTASEAKHVLGAQGNVWTEYIKTADHVEYMVFPRLLALAEVVWSPREQRAWRGFTTRLPAQLSRLDRLQVNYRVPHVRGLENDRITLDDRAGITLTSLIPTGTIRYTLDGTDVGPESPAYAAPLEVPVDADGLEVRARLFLHDGRASPLQSARFAKASLQPGVDVDASGLRPGLQMAYYEASMSSVNRLARYSPVREGRAPTVQLPGFEREERFGLVFRGFLRAPQAGVYEFLLTSDDGSDLVIGGHTVIDHDGLHSATDQRGMIALDAGYHPITVRFFQGGGGKDLRLSGRLGTAGDFFTMEDWLFSLP